MSLGVRQMECLEDLHLQQHPGGLVLWLGLEFRLQCTLAGRMHNSGGPVGQHCTVAASLEQVATPQTPTPHSLTESTAQGCAGWLEQM